MRERQRADAKVRTSAVRGRARGFGGKPVGMLSDPALLRVSSELSNFSTSCGEVVMLSSDDVMFVVVMDGVSSGSRLTDC